ncbi:MAG: DUF1634 domain-containing protein, partial [Thermoplasmata archaeon]|nr:DUF1634 domain-containing protein [Thermoplasmata archaeon]
MNGGKLKGAHRFIHAIYIAGISVSLVLILAGLVLYVTTPPQTDMAVAPDELLPNLMDGDAGAVVTLGLMALLATPICGVLALTASFTFQRDTRFVLISLLVLV